MVRVKRKRAGVISKIHINIKINNKIRSKKKLDNFCSVKNPKPRRDDDRKEKQLPQLDEA